MQRKNNMTKEEFLQLSAPLVGDKRTFEFDKREFSIRAIVFPSPDITMNWTWTTRVDPKTKKRIVETRIHTFYRIELLGAIGIKDDDLTLRNSVLLGFSLDGRLMVIPIDTYKTVFAQINGFNKIKAQLV